MTTFDVGSICYRQYEFQFVTRLARLLAMKPTPGFIACNADGQATSRNIVASHFLTNSTSQVLVFIDADIVFEPADVPRIADKAMEHQAVVGGIYSARTSPTKRPIAMFHEKDTITFFDPHSPEIVPVEYVSGGFMAIPRTVLETLARELRSVHSATRHTQWPFFRMTDTFGDAQYGEDWPFLDLARDAGFPILADTTIRLGHIGQYTYMLGDMINPSAYNGPLEITRDGDQYSAVIPRREFLVE